MLGLLVQRNMGRLETIFHENSWKNHLKLKRYYAEKLRELTGIKHKVIIGVETGNYQLKELLMTNFQIQYIQVSMKQNQSFIYI